jgi:transposase-like protein
MIEELIANARTTAGGRRFYSSEQKSYIVEESESSTLSFPEFCRRYGLIASQIYKWRNDAKRGAVMRIRNEGELHSKIGFNILKKENEDLKKALGESAFHITILKKS